MATTRKELLVLKIILYIVTWSSHNAAALAQQRALSSSPSLTLFQNESNYNIILFTNRSYVILLYITNSHQYPKNIIIVVLKPLYRIVEAGTYQQAIYNKYYKEKFLITTFIFNPYFLIITIGTLFGIISIQTNNIIILKDDQFLALKEDKLVKVNLIVKLKEKLNLIILLLFNRYILFLNIKSITLR